MGVCDCPVDTPIFNGQICHNDTVDSNTRTLFSVPITCPNGFYNLNNYCLKIQIPIQGFTKRLNYVASRRLLQLLQYQNSGK